MDLHPSPTSDPTSVLGFFLPLNQTQIPSGHLEARVLLNNRHPWASNLLTSLGLSFHTFKVWVTWCLHTELP